MKRVEYHFVINHKLIGEVLKIAEEGEVSYAFKYDLKKLYDESTLTPNKDMTWYLGRLISSYYTVELISYDSTFSKINNFLLSEWQKSIPTNQQEDMKRRVFHNTYSSQF